MADREEELKLTADFSDLEKAVKRGVKKLNKLGVSLKEVTGSNVAFDKSGKPVISTLKGLTEEGAKVTAAFELQGRTLKATKVEIANVTTATQEAAKAQKEAATAAAAATAARKAAKQAKPEKLTATVQARVDDAVKQTKAREREAAAQDRRVKAQQQARQKADEKTLADNKITQAKLIAANDAGFAQRLAKFEAANAKMRAEDKQAQDYFIELEKKTTQAKTTEFKKQVAAARTAQDERKAIARQSAADKVTSGFSANRTSSASSVAELNKVAAAEEKLTRTIVDSGVKIKRAQQVVAEAFKNPAKAFVGAEQKIAASARSLNKSLTESGNASRKHGEATKATAEKIAAADAKVEAQQVAAHKKKIARLDALRVAVAKQRKAQEDAARVTADLSKNRISAAATVAELNKVAAAQERLTRTIVSSGTTAARAQQVVAEAIEKPGKAFVGVEQQIASAARSLNKELTNTGTAAQKYGEKINNAGKQGSEAAKQTLISWKSFGRLLVTQQIHNAINLITRSMREAVQESVKFQIQISEIRTIAQDNQLSFQTWSNEVDALALRFGQTGTDVAEAAYQTLSNQVAKGTEVFGFLNEALKLSKAATGTTADAVNALSSVLNSYKLSTLDAGRVSDTLFKTIELGRIRLADVANTLGRVTNITSTAGISFEETAAALQTLTISGLQMGRAQTFLINAVKGILKPSEAMKAILDKVSSGSGEVLLSTKGLAGALQILQDETGGSIDKLKDLFPNMRGLQGIIGLTGGSLQKFIDNWKETQSAIGSVDKAVGIVFESSGKKLAVEFNKITILIRKAGTIATDVIVGATERYGGLAAVLKNVGKALIVVTAAVVAFTAVTALLAAGAVYAAAVATSFGAAAVAILIPLSGPAGIVALLAAAAAGFLLFRKTATEAAAESFELLRKQLDRQEEFRVRDLSAQRDVVAKKIKLEAEAQQEILALEHNTLKDRAAAQQEFLDAASQALDLSVTATNRAFNGLISGLKSELKAFQSVITSSQAFLDTIDSKVQATLDVIFQKTETAAEKFSVLVGRIREAGERIRKIGKIDFDGESGPDFANLQKESAKLFASQAKAIQEQAKLQQKVEEEQIARKNRIQEISKRIFDLERTREKQERAIKQKRSIGKGGNRRVKISAFNNAKKNREEAAAKTDRDIGAAREDLREEREKSVQSVTTVKNLTDSINKATADILKTQKAINQEAERRQKLARQQLAATQQVVDVAKQLFRDTSNLDVVGADGGALKTAGKDVADLTSRINAFEGIVLKVEGLGDLTKSIGIVKDLRQRVNELRDQLQLANEITEVKKKSADAQAITKAQLAANEELIKTIDLREKEAKQLRDAAVLAAGVLKGTTLNQFLSVRDESGKLTSANLSEVLQTQLLNNDLESARETLTQLLREADIFANFNKNTRITANTEEVLTALGILRSNLTQLEQRTTEAVDLRAVQSKLIFDRSEAALQNVQERLRLEKRILELFKDGNLAGKVKTKVDGNALGGFVRRAMGGHGIDNVPAMLNSNEFVMNRGASKKFRNTLMRMNSGLPSFAGGGSVGGTTVGDINVSVNGGSTSESTIQEIGKGLRREIRRGRLKF